MKTSLIYRIPLLYTLLIRILYGKNYNARTQLVAEEIPDGASVLDICCGDCTLYSLALKERVSYVGVDINPYFIKKAKKHSIKALQMDIISDEIPKSEYVVMQGSLYQFFPNYKKIVDKLLDSATKKVIISEPIKNLSDSDNPIIAFIAKHSANPGTGHKMARFNDKTLHNLFEENYKDLIEKFKYIPGNRELIVILNKQKGIKA